MYQTVGHSGLVTLAKALQLPLFKRTITGQAIHVGGDYGDRKAAVAGGTTGDETEDLYELLRTVKVRNPSSGPCNHHLPAAMSSGSDARDPGSCSRCNPVQLSARARRARVSDIQAGRQVCPTDLLDSCSRLGLTPIAFLWERNQEELLQEMVKAGMNSVLVKVAGAG